MASLMYTGSLFQSRGANTQKQLSPAFLKERTVLSFEKNEKEH